MSQPEPPSPTASLPGETAAAETAARGLPYAKLALVAGLVIALLLVGRQAGEAFQTFAAWVEGLGVWAPVVFVLGYAGAVTALLPGALLTIAGGAIFGLAEGTLYVFIAAVLGSVSAFLISRYAARGFVEKRIADNPRFAAVDRAIADNGLKITFLLRLSPAFPFSFLNYALGLTRVSFRDYLIASIGMLPGTVLYVYYGKVAGDVASLAGGAPEGGSEQTLFTILGLVATIAVTTIVTRIARRALREATDTATDA